MNKAIRILACPVYFVILLIQQLADWIGRSADWVYRKFRMIDRKFVEFFNKRFPLKQKETEEE